MKIRTAKAILLRLPRMKRFDSQNFEAGETTAGSVNLIRGNNSSKLEVVRAVLEWRLANLVIEERQILMPVTNEYLDLFCNDSGRAAVHKEGVS